jgi:hypothetical protein
MIADPKLPFTKSPGLPDVEPPPSASSYAPAPPDSPRPLSGLHLWLRRAGVLMFVFLCATVGVMLMILPWRPEWTDNHLLFAYPALRNFMATGFVRGVCTGLGVLNVWIGFWEAVQYREEE